MGEQINLNKPEPALESTVPDSATGTPLHPASAPALTPAPAKFPPVTAAINADAGTIYNYHRMGLPLFDDDNNTSSSSPLSSGTTTTTTAIFALCSLDMRVAHRAASLFLSLSSESSRPDAHYCYSHLIFSGNVGALTAGRFHGPEAEVFAAVAASPPYNIPRSRIIVEPRATNTGENVRFTHALLQSRGLLGNGGGGGGGPPGRIGRFVLVQKPYMERRTYATFVKQWPGGTDGGVKFTVTSPQVEEWDEYPDEQNPRELVISIMVGDLVRIKEYPARGFQIEQEITDEVWEAGQRLINAGFNAHLP